ncbi:hypothetical protein BDZ90DRAFT_230891 [Jaminaea rosea]|uniref:Uncharacterized protein n=1 Tax=Jaminaea rosea TaxID=1569628 RepID=A0A316UYA5_9BASI|nr:hypothetical protein BDZ90DRAFT_230891 [Jaminaea rosea]PWN28883.1 hypothetical protein BDZ90DRAFT_230891 [Jaminaea rosea]
MQGNDQNVEADRSSSPHHITANANAAAAAAAKGILRDAAPTLPPTHNVAFMDPHHGANARREYRLEGSAVTDTSVDSDPLVFAKRPVLGLNNRSRSSFSTTCTSPTSEASLATNATSAYTHTPSLCRSDTEVSDAPGDDGEEVKQEEEGQPPVSLLTAALMAEGAVAPQRVNIACGILRKETSDGNGGAEHQHHDSGKVSFAGQGAPSAKARFAEPPKPARIGGRRVSLPPPQAKGARLSVSPEHYSEGPESPPRPLLFDAQAHASFLPPAGPSVLKAEGRASPPLEVRPEQPARKRTLVFQDAAGVEERARARAVAADAAAKAAAMMKGSERSGADAGPSSTKVHPSDAPTPPIRSRSPSPAQVPVSIHESMLTQVSAKLTEQVATTERKLTFAASPSELRRSASARRSLRRPRPRSSKASLSISSDEEGRPYVDSVAAASSQRSGRAGPPRRHRSGSPAPKKLGGPETKRGSGKGRPRSPAPRGRVALPRSATPDADDLDYEEDDEGSDDDDDEDDDSSQNDTSEDEDGIGSYKPEAPLSSSPVAIAPSPRPSVDSQSHPAAFSHSDFEDEDGTGERITDREVGPSSYELPLVHSRQRSPNPWPMSNHGSPLSFARGRLPTPAISDIEGASLDRGSRRPSMTTSHRTVSGGGAASGTPLSPSLSPSRSRSRLSPIPVKPAASRSFSSAAVEATGSDPRRCEPSTFASCEQVLGGNTTTSGSPQQYVGAHSPDAWTTLRSCLESAMLSDGEQQAPSQGQQQQQPRWRRPAWSSARSTPGTRSVVLTPSRGVSGEMAAPSSRSYALGQQLQSFSTAALHDSSAAASSSSAGPSQCPSPQLGGAGGAVLAPPVKLDSDTPSATTRPAKPIRIDSDSSTGLSREEGHLAGIGEEQARRLRRKEQQH